MPAAAAVTEEVSLTAVPANRPKPVVRHAPAAPPSVGKMRAANTLNRKMTEMDCATSSSLRLDDGRRGRDGRAAADGRAHADRAWRCPLACAAPYTARKPRSSAVAMVEQDDGQRQHAHPGDLHEVQPEAQQHDRALQHLLARERNARLHPAARGRLPEQGHDHARQDGKHGPPTSGNASPKNQQGRAMATQAAMPGTFSMQPDKGLFKGVFFPSAGSLPHGKTAMQKYSTSAGPPRNCRMPKSPHAAQVHATAKQTAAERGLFRWSSLTLRTCSR